jgi:restriction endonuclease S subunit
VSRRVEIGDVATAFIGVNPGRLPTSDSLPEIPLINIKDIENGFIADRERLTKLKNSGLLPQQYLRSGDVLVSIRGTLLKTAIVQEQHKGAFASANIAAFRPISSVIIPEVLQAVFLSPNTRNSLLNLTTGSVIKGLQIGHLKKVCFTLPPLKDQEDLAKFLRLSSEQHRLSIQLSNERRDFSFSLAARHLEKQ